MTSRDAEGKAVLLPLEPWVPDGGSSPGASVRSIWASRASLLSQQLYCERRFAFNSVHRSMKRCHCLEAGALLSDGLIIRGSIQDTAEKGR